LFRDSPRLNLRAISSYALVLLLAGAASGLEKPRIRVTDYVINADITPKSHHLRAAAKVTFTALDDISAVVFELHNAMRVTGVTDASGEKLSTERFSQENAVRVSLAQGLAKNASSYLIFNYEGELSSADDSPVEGVKLAYISEDSIYLLYPGRWFPVTGYNIDRFTSRINVAVPAGYIVVGSGRQTGAMFSPEAPLMAEAGPAATQPAAPSPSPRFKGSVTAAKPQSRASAGIPAGKMIFSFAYSKPSFPGTIIAGQFQQLGTAMRAGGVNVYFSGDRRQYAQAYADSAVKEMEFFAGWYGPPPSPTLNVVELPDDSVPSAWAPEIAAIAARAIKQKVDYRLLANTIAHQWWGGNVSPSNRDDAWLRDGGARYAEAFYVESAAGEAGFQEAMKDIEVGALAFNNIPLASAGKLDPFTPEAQSLNTEKGAMVFSMLRWVLGDANFNKTMRQFQVIYAEKSASTDDLRKIAEQNYTGPLNWFFAQWLDSTGAPEFHNKYTVYRLGNGKGFRVTGEIRQDLDLFRMPVELRIETDGKPETRRIDVAGTESPYSVETFGEPRKIKIDPNNRVLKNSGDLKLRVAILKAEQSVQQGDYPAALDELQQALALNKMSSLAHYRIAEVFFQQHNYQAAADEYRACMSGDGEPRWTEVWSHVRLGQLYDITGQRSRATNEYRQALETNDNTSGAMDEARKYLTTPYQQERAKSG